MYSATTTAKLNVSKRCIKPDGNLKTYLVNNVYMEDVLEIKFQSLTKKKNGFDVILFYSYPLVLVFICFLWYR